MKREFEVTYLWRPVGWPRNKRSVHERILMPAKTMFELFAKLENAHVDGDFKPPIRIVRIEELPPFNPRKEN